MSQQRGLSARQAKKAQKKHGPNKLPEKPPPSSFSIFVSQLKNPLVYVLLVASVVTLVLGEYSDTVIILLAVVINTLLGFVQEKRASSALEALKQMVHPTTKVVRSGQMVEIPIEEVAVGDLVVLNQGMRIPADGSLIMSNRMFVDEAMLTGESRPVEKKEGSEAFMGTVVTSGRGEMVVEKIGKETQMGGIALRVQEPDEQTPLKRQISQFSKQLTALVLGLVLFVFVVGSLSGMRFEEIFSTSVALAVSAIPEGLLIGMTAVLAIGMQRIAARKGLVRHLVSAETLGAVSTICADKTGTLTAGRMKVVEVLGNKKMLAEQAKLANDLDDPIVIAAWEWAKKQIESDISEHKNERIDSIPFSSKARFFASLNKWSSKKNMLFVNGAAEYLLEWSSLSASEKQKVYKQIDKLTLDGKRVLGMARKTTSSSYKKINEKNVKTNLDWVGLLAFEDPVRRGVQAALKKTQKAGIRTLIITGDYTQTALAVMKKLELEIKDENVLTGSDLLTLSQENLAKKLTGNEIYLFARTTPDQKLKIVEALKENGEVVAMMGDGVNDAPALKKADIGIVVGTATDVAKGSADLVLLDSNFATIVAAVEEGRGIFDNIRKVILYLMTDAFSEIVAIVGSILMGLPLAVTAVQILWINLVSDGFPNLALTVDPKAEGLMSRRPRPANSNVVANWMKVLISSVSLVGGVSALILFQYYFNQTSDLILARSVAFATLGVNSLVYVFSIRTLTKPFWSQNMFKNKWLNAAVVGGLILQFLPYSLQSLQRFFEVKPLNVTQLSTVFAAALSMFIIIEVSKVFIKAKT